MLYSLNWFKEVNKFRYDQVYSGGNKLIDGNINLIPTGAVSLDFSWFHMNIDIKTPPYPIYMMLHDIFLDPYINVAYHVIYEQPLKLWFYNEEIILACQKSSAKTKGFLKDASFYRL